MHLIFVSFNLIFYDSIFGQHNDDSRCTLPHGERKMQINCKPPNRYNMISLKRNKRMNTEKQVHGFMWYSHLSHIETLLFISFHLSPRRPMKCCVLDYLAFWFPNECLCIDLFSTCSSHFSSLRVCVSGCIFFHFIFCILRIVSADYLLVQKETLIISLFFFVFVVRNKNTRIHLIHTHIIFITIYMCFNLLPMKEEPIMRSRNGPKSEGEKE